MILIINYGYFEAGVQMEFNAKTDDMLEMRVVDVSVDSK